MQLNKTPVKQIIITTIIAITLNSINFGAYLNQIEPLWILLFYSYFLLNFTIKNEYFIALIIGIIIDSISGEIIGQTSFALILSSYFIVQNKDSIKNVNILTIIVFMSIVSLVYLISILGIHIIIQGINFNYSIFFSLITTAIFYPLIDKLMQQFNENNHYF